MPRLSATRPRPRSLPAAPLPTSQGPSQFFLSPETVGQANGFSTLTQFREGLNELQFYPEEFHQWITRTDVAPLFRPDSVKLSPAPQYDFGYKDLISNNDIFYPHHRRHRILPSEDPSTISGDAPSSAGSTFSPVQTEQGEPFTGQRSPCPSQLGKTVSTVYAEDEVRDRLADYQKLVCLGPQCHMSFQSDIDLRTHVQAVHNHTCSWAGCLHPSFASRKELAWHVKAEHLLICPVLECSDESFQSNRELTSHIAVEHPESGRDAVKEWELPPAAADTDEVTLQNNHSVESTPTKSTINIDSKFKAAVKEVMSVARAKKKCQERLWSVVEKKARKSSGTPRAADSPTDLVRNRASRALEAASFPLVFEHAVLPFLAEFIPKWSGPRHVISCTRGRTPQHRRICIMTTAMLSRTRKIIIARHVADLLPEKYRRTVSFVFSVGQISRAARWARGLSKEHPDDVRSARNPYHFNTPCMGDSVGISREGHVEESTATLGPCLDVDRGSYWLVNFHPFLDAYRNLAKVNVEHPSPQDREPCLVEGHDCLSQEASFKLGIVTVTSGLNLKTTRISHDPYWEDNDLEQPLVVTDWALVTSNKSVGGRANVLRRFPSETQPPMVEPLVKSVCSGVSGVIPGASVLSSGRTSGYQRGMVCEIPAYVSAEENGTGKATREWFVEEPFSPTNNEDAWIRGGIGVEGDSGAAIVDAETNLLYGQLWGRNKYWGPGPRITFFTSAADIFDDIQEKCGLQSRPRLPQIRDEADRYAVYPSCRRCYDLKTYLDSRRSSRVSLQSMINYRSDADHDLTSSIENVSELATPRDYPRGSGTGMEEIGASFTTTSSPIPPFGFSAGSPPVAWTSPYAQTLAIDEHAAVDNPKFRDTILEAVAMEPAPKRRSICLDQGRLFTPDYSMGSQPKRKRTGK